MATSTSALTAAQPGEVTAVSNETKLIDAQRAKLEAQIALLKKQAELDALKAGTSPQ